MKSVLSILMLALLASCYTQQKAADQMDKAHSRYELIAAGKCANWYPIKIDTQQGPTIYVPGETKTVPGPTVFVNCDSLNRVIAAMKSEGRKDIPDGTRVPADCPPSKLRVDTIKVPYYITKENTAAKRELELKLQKSEKSSGTKNGIIGALAILFLLAVIGNIIQLKSNKSKPATIG